MIIYTTKFTWIVDVINVAITKFDLKIQIVMKNISELDISNINDAYLLISDEDLREEDLKKLLTNFKKDHIFLLGFECHSHPCHEPILKNGIHNMIGNTFCNYDFRKYTFNNNRYWIPTFHFMPESILSR